MSFSNTIHLKNLTIDHLWNSLRSGEKPALEAIYTLYIKDLYSFGMSLHADEALVKDAIQDVFIDLWNYRAKLCSDVIVKQYLFKSLSNRIQKELGKNARRSSVHWLTDQESSVNSIEDELVKNQAETEITDKMYGAMDKLPIRQKEVLQYLFFEKLSYEETANLLDINIRSTYTLAWKAINALKKAITVLGLVIFLF
ncbi:RNA polymerase sigma factor (sigma-70 family) [Algoriphagus ratkowskyi]|uniref:RNA polymerase sigma factor (Sigma-70 family) n=1 Tax=Algoriphagus ratkowskyi TaxID=57028 RepID=A0A2W7RLH7_9BACT|nr:sigma-70 family RNA polymerase sigma factor [Algoriphagus ratkowskyi]PZX55439.1 RNA polymerase sigma factor (sigma-70 family) [Algoriphagus ratkowskyi]TXD79641.1 sigma-70 family RNA polymerase sigma factor [Algoriphagus ratkowskyi]